MVFTPVRSFIRPGLASSHPTNRLATANVDSTEIGIGEVLILKGRIPEAVSYVRHAMNLVETRQHKTAYDVAGQAESYSTLGKVDEALANREFSATKKAAHLREARAWLKKSVRTWQQDPNHGSPDPMGGREGDHAREELSKCQLALTKL